MDTKHSLLSDHGLDSAKSAVPHTLSLVHHPVRHIRLGLQDPRQYWLAGQLPVAGDHRLGGLGETIDDIVIDDRFIVARPIAGTLVRSVIVADVVWWIDNEQEIEQWMDANLERGRFCRQGMVIEFDDQEDLALFLLAWQGPQ